MMQEGTKQVMSKNFIPATMVNNSASLDLVIFPPVKTNRMALCRR